MFKTIYQVQFFNWFLQLINPNWCSKLVQFQSRSPQFKIEIKVGCHNFKIDIDVEHYTSNSIFKFVFHNL